MKRVYCDLSMKCVCDDRDDHPERGKLYKCVCKRIWIGCCLSNFRGGRCICGWFPRAQHLCGVLDVSDSEEVTDYEDRPEYGMEVDEIPELEEQDIDRWEREWVIRVK